MRQLRIDTEGQPYAREAQLDLDLSKDWTEALFFSMLKCKGSVLDGANGKPSNSLMGVSTTATRATSPARRISHWNCRSSWWIPGGNARAKGQFGSEWKAQSSRRSKGNGWRGRTEAFTCTFRVESSTCAISCLRRPAADGGAGGLGFLERYPITTVHRTT